MFECQELTALVWTLWFWHCKLYWVPQGVWVQYYVFLPFYWEKQFFWPCLLFWRTYHISSIIRQKFFLPKQSQRSRSILQDGSRSLRLFRKGKTHIIAKFHKTDLVISSHFRERKTLSYNQINTIALEQFFSFKNWPIIKWGKKMEIGGLPRSGKKIWKMKFFPGQGKVGILRMVREI